MLAMASEIFLDEARAEMNVQLNQGFISNAAKTVDLSRLDHENVARAGLEFLAIDGPEAATALHELDFIVGVAMRSWTASRRRVDEVDRNVHISVVGSYELMRHAVERQTFLTDVVHPAVLLLA